jgi:dTDP-4-dehydrorhamnose 3,5-epimerase-like enzyme
MTQEPKLFKGGISVDDRGSVSFVNDFNFDDVKRFYMIKNHRLGFIRAWHGHKNEAKYFNVVKGSALICGVRIDDWNSPSKELTVHRFVLSETTPSILFLPAGYANGAMSLTQDAQIMVFSTSTLQDSLNDDIRFDSRYWNPWTIEER